MTREELKKTLETAELEKEAAKGHVRQLLSANLSLAKEISETKKSREELEKAMETALREKDEFIANMSKQIQQPMKMIKNYTRMLKEEVEERKKAEAALKEARQSAEIANQAKSIFLANMSHEIRTPMNAILGFAEILEEKIKDAQNKQYLSAIDAAGKSLLTLIDDILDLSKVEAGKLSLEYADINPRLVFEEIKAVFSKKVADKELDLRIAIDPSLPACIVTDEIRLRQILLNLVGNAVKFTSAGFVEISASFKYADRNSGASEFIFSVEDTGIGIPEQERQHIFGAFEQQTGQSTAKFGGTGLGLAITNRLITMMGGTIEIGGEQGKGSKFTINIKGVEIGEIRESDEKTDDFDVNSIKFDKASILLVDDEELNRRLLRSYLEDYEFEIIEAVNGKEALELARNYRPDVILMDRKMPVMGGYDAIQILKQDHDLKSIPVIVQSASAMKDEVEMLVGISDGYLVKPIKKTTFISKLSEYLDHTVESAASEDTGQPEPEPGEDVPLVELDAEALFKLPELLEILDDLRKNSLDEIYENLAVNDIEDFATRVSNLGQEYHCPHLSEWGERLLNQAIMFDMDAMPKTLDSFGQIIDKISNMLSDKAPFP